MMSWLLTAFAGGLTALVVWFTWPFSRRPVRPAPVERPAAIVPRDEHDPFCTCPKCGLLGNHAVEVRHQAGIRRIQSGEEWVEVGMWGSAPPGPYAHRTCWSCGHTWRTHVQT